jgi:hypothetical protein
MSTEKKRDSTDKTTIVLTTILMIPVTWHSFGTHTTIECCDADLKIQQVLQ